MKRIAVLDRTMEPGAIGDPLYMDVKTMYFDDKKGTQNMAVVMAWVPGCTGQISSI